MAKKAQSVDEFMATLDHPFKAEVQAIREIILGVDKRISEEVKWSAPTFSYKGYLVSFNLWQKKFVQLVFHNAAILNDRFGLLEGDYPDRRLAAFADMAEVKAKKAALVKVVKAWIKEMDK